MPSHSFHPQQLCPLWVQLTEPLNSLIVLNKCSSNFRISLGSTMPEKHKFA